MALSSGSPAYPPTSTSSLVKPNLANLTQPKCFLNIDSHSDKKVEVASQAESSEGKLEVTAEAAGASKEKGGTKPNLQNSSSSAKK